MFYKIGNVCGTAIDTNMEVVKYLLTLKFKDFFDLSLTIFIFELPFGHCDGKVTFLKILKSSDHKKIFFHTFVFTHSNLLSKRLSMW